MTLAPAVPRTAALAAALLLTALAAPAAAETTHEGRTVLSAGHTDAMKAYLEGDRLVLRVSDDTGDTRVERDPEEVLFQVLPEAETAIPEGGILSFLGEPGDPMWLLPFTQDHDLLWPGWSTEALKAGQFQGDRIQMSLVSVEGPGHLALWSLSNFGSPSVLFNSRDGLPDAVDVNVNAHVHAAWAFTAEGEYTLTWKVSGTLADGTAVTSGNVEYRWHVGELPSDDPGGGDPGAPDLGDRLVLDRGHVDVFNADVDGGRLGLDVKDGSKVHDGEVVHRDPGDVAFHVVPDTETTLTEAQLSMPGWDVLGEAGDTVWLLPDVDQAGKLFAGWSTEGIAADELAEDRISLALSGAEGPGDLKMFQVDDFGQATLLVDSGDGVPDRIDTPARTHAHANWIFTEPGVYTLTWRAETTLADGTRVASDPEEYVFVVDEWPADDPGTGGPGGPGGPGDPDLENTQTITATVDTDTGGLVISVDPNDRDVVLPALALDSTATRWAAEGELRPVTVTDTRSADPGWNAAAQVSQFASADGGFSGAHLGWLPGVVSTGERQQVTPGPAVAGLLDGGPGLSTSQILAVATAGSGKGTCVLDADLRLDLPTDVESGTYTALVTFTAI
ncbi:choice-of-anchor M domain-containing protein [Glycomyces sp. TRM65418]|uniref:choice-of-anchor M domain-containing protein n=1 Tax=Glycomyces sp. TRM65418 TaxID=2867006 RepID=UPI001CE62B9B|nr:choice-of-anchor M domain-containing protein [Glycomyces sp. TRM65418]MCC3763111.1 choice-of-anchor M domain-containing protein [Glycomyces sp. TRM65418]QZD57119.1 choice-of-anchor M domain-containing protein [Glycomyces sp. TRM65418]